MVAKAVFGFKTGYIPKQKFPQAVLFQRGFVHVPRAALPTEDKFRLLESELVTTQRPLSKQVHPLSQHSEADAYRSHG